MIWKWTYLKKYDYTLSLESFIQAALNKTPFTSSKEISLTVPCKRNCLKLRHRKSSYLTVWCKMNCLKPRHRAPNFGWWSEKKEKEEEWNSSSCTSIFNVKNYSSSRRSLILWVRFWQCLICQRKPLGQSGKKGIALSSGSQI